MSEQCMSIFQDSGSSYRCVLPLGHTAPHENGDWEWWEGAAPTAQAEQKKNPIEYVKMRTRPDYVQEILTGMDKLLQSHAALAKQVDGLQFALEERLNKLDALVKGTGDGCVAAIQDLRKDLLLDFTAEEIAGIRAGIEDMKAGRVKSLTQIEKELGIAPPTNQKNRASRKPITRRAGKKQPLKQKTSRPGVHHAAK